MSEEIILKIKVKPNARKAKIVKKKDDYWKIKVKASPIEGKANQELMKVLADEFNVPLLNVEIKKGLKSREKIVRITL